MRANHPSKKVPVVDDSLSVVKSLVLVLVARWQVLVSGALLLKSSKIVWSGRLEKVWERTPPSGVRNGIETAIKVPEGTSAEIAAILLGNGSDVSAQDTIPFALWAAACHLGDYEEALWATVAALGDRDTTCAIVGGIVVLCTGRTGTPQQWLECREPLLEYLAGNDGSWWMTIYGLLSHSFCSASIRKCNVVVVVIRAQKP